MHLKRCFEHRLGLLEIKDPKAALASSACFPTFVFLLMSEGLHKLDGVFEGQ